MEETTLLPHSIEQQGMVYQDRNQKIHKVLARFEGFTKEYFVSDYDQRAAILAVRDNQVLLVRQYRLIINDISYEIPGGRVNDGETPEIAAVRECLEESGVRCQNLKPLLSFHPGLDILHNPTHVFYTEDLVETTGEHLKPREVIRHLWIPLGRCIEMVFAQQIVDGLSVVALLAYQKSKAR